MGGWCLRNRSSRPPHVELFSCMAHFQLLAPAAIEDARRDVPLPVDTDAIDIVDLAQPNLRRDTRDDLRAQLHKNNGNHRAAIIDSDGNKKWVLLRERGGRFHLGWRVATGPAAGPGAPGLASGRRCYSGWLGRYALKARAHAAPTAMEPELAFLMANWARITPSSRVLDPTCGSCGLLMSAAALGATHLVGVDQNASAFENAPDDFERLALPPPTLFHGDVLTRDETPALSDATYDAIISDPPYNLRAPVYVGGSVSSSQDPNPAADLTAAVIRLAERTLAPNGRLVLFVPARGDEIDLTLSELLEKRMAASSSTSSSQPLKLVHGRLQRFSTRRSRRAGSSAVPQKSNGPGAFARWLVCLERSTDDEKEQSSSLLSAVNACGGDWQAAASLVAGSSDVYATCAAMSACAKAGEWRTAIDLLEGLEGTADAACYHTAIHACSKARPSEVADAASCAFNLLETMDGKDGFAPPSMCFTAAGRAALRSGDWSKALAAFEEIQRRELPLQYGDVKAAMVAAAHGKQWERVASLAMMTAKELQPADAQSEWLWKAWSDAQLRRIRDSLDSSSLASRVDADATSDLQKALGVAASEGSMPSFADGGARAGYTLAHLSSRTRKVADTLRLASPKWLKDAVKEAMASSSVAAVSLGGGPGFDFAALALLHAYTSDDGGGTAAAPRTLVLDYESGWSDRMRSANRERVHRAWCKWRRQLPIRRVRHHSSCQRSVKPPPRCRAANDKALHRLLRRRRECHPPRGIGL